MPRPISWYQRKLAFMGIQSVVTEIINLKDGFKMDYTQQKQINDNDTRVRVSAPTEIWNSALPLGKFRVKVCAIPTIQENKNDKYLHLEIPIQFESGRKAKYQLQINNPDWLMSTHSVFDEIGVPYKQDENTGFLDFDRKDFVGLEFQVLIEAKESKKTGRTYNNITRVFNKDYVEPE